MQLTRRGNLSVRKMKRAQILILADKDHKDETIAYMLNAGISIMHRTRQKLVEESVEFALNEYPRPGGNLYAKPYHPDESVVCFDKRPCQLIGETQVPRPLKPGHPERYDYEYERKGTCNI